MFVALIQESNAFLLHFQKESSGWQVKVLSRDQLLRGNHMYFCKTMFSIHFLLLLTNCCAIIDSPKYSNDYWVNVLTQHKEPQAMRYKDGTRASQRIKEDPEKFTQCREGAGAYYQMFTKEKDATGAPYTYISADVYVAGADTHSIKIANPNKDVAFVFLGGNGTDGWWLDAGLQYSPVRKDWALFFWDEGKALEARGRPFTFKRKLSPALTPEQRFAPNQTIKLEMFIPQKAVLGARETMDNRVTVIARGRQRTNNGVRGKEQVRRYIFEVPGGWPRSVRANGRGINLRYTVSLAQVGRVDLTTGSYFRGTRISNVYVGSSYATRRPLRRSDIASLCRSPNDQVVQMQNGVISINYAPEVQGR